MLSSVLDPEVVAALTGIHKITIQLSVQLPRHGHAPHSYSLVVHYYFLVGPAMGSPCFLPHGLSSIARPVWCATISFDSFGAEGLATKALFRQKTMCPFSRQRKEAGMFEIGTLRNLMLHANLCSWRVETHSYHASYLTGRSDDTWYKDVSCALVATSFCSKEKLG